MGLSTKCPIWKTEQDFLFLSASLLAHHDIFIIGTLDSKVSPLTGVRESTEDRVAVITVWKKSGVGDSLTLFLFL